MLLARDGNAWENYLWWQAQGRKVRKRINLRNEPLGENGPTARKLRLGFDTSARQLETVVLVFGSGDEMVI